MKSIRIFLAAFCILPNLVVVASVCAEVVAEGFDQNSAEPIVIADGAGGENVVRFLSSQLSWGGFCETARRGVFTIVDPSGETCVVFNDGAAVPGSYLYTRFDKAAGWQPMDLSGNAARVVLTLFWCRKDMGLAVMLRDKDRWWLSSPVDIRAIGWNARIDTRYVLDPRSLKWSRLENAADLDELDDDGAVALKSEAAGRPHWGSICGMGVWVARGTPEDKFYLSGLSLADGLSPKADLREPMKNSDVAFLHVASPLEKYDAYGGAKIVYWDSGWRANHVALTRDYGVRDAPAASMGVIKNSVAQANPKLKAAICRDLWGKEITVGNPTFPNGVQARMCTRQPPFLEYVKDYVKRHIYDVGAREALMDEPSGTIGARMLFRDDAGCFCDECNNAFRSWLQANRTPAQLAAMGIADLAGFDYRALLKSKVSDLADYQRQFDKGELPHMRSFIQCQREPQRRFFCEVRDHMLAIDPSFRFTANTYNLQPHLFYLVEELNGDFHGAETELYLYNLNLLGHVVQRLKLADALGIRVVTSGVHWEFEHVRKHNLVNVLKPVIAAHYASGHQLAVPDLYRWIEPDFYGSIPDLAPYYRFVRAYASLFDDYLPVEQVGLIMSLGVADQHTGDGQFLRDYARIGQELIDRCIPFGVAVAADGFYYKKEFTGDELVKRFHLVIEPRNTGLSGTQLAALSGMKAQGKVHVWDDQGLAPVLSKIQPWVSCDQPGIFVLPRRKPGDPAAPLIVHLINRDYREKEDRAEEKHNIQLTLRRELLGRPIAGMECVSPEAARRTIAWEAVSDGAVVTVPELKFWNIIEIRFSNPSP